MALCLPAAVPSSTAFKCRLAPAHNARVADEKADALSGTHRLFSSATPAPLVRHSRHDGWVSEGPQAAKWPSSDCQPVRSTGARGAAVGLVGLVVGFLDS